MVVKVYTHLVKAYTNLFKPYAHLPNTYIYLVNAFILTLVVRWNNTKNVSCIIEISDETNGKTSGNAYKMIIKITIIKINKDRQV